MATTFTWLGTISASWNDPLNWNTHTLTPGAASSDVILFNGAGTTAATDDFNLNFDPDRMIISNPNVTLTFIDGTTFNIDGVNATSGLYMSAGTVSLTANVAQMGMNTGSISGGILTIGANNEADILNNGTLTLTSAGSISLTGGEFDIGFQSGDFGGSPDGNTPGSTAGLVYVSGGELLVTGGNLTALAYLQDNSNASGSVFDQTAGAVAISGNASFTDGTGTVATGGLFQAGTIAIGMNFTINGGTVQALSGGGGVVVGSGDVVTMTGGTLDGTNGGIANSGTITGKGEVLGDIGTGGTVVASGGLMEIGSAQSGAAPTYTIASGATLQFDGAVADSGTVHFADATSGDLQFKTATASGGFADSVANLGTASANSVSGDNFIEILGTTVGTVVAGASNHQFDGSENVFTVYGDVGETQVLGTFQLTASNANLNNVYVDWINTGGNSEIFLSTAICYAKGTLIETDAGEIAVESLQAGDRVVTLQDGQRVPMPVKWLGIRHMDLTAHPHPHMAAPIRIRAGAFGTDLPRRDLLVSPAHCIYVDGKLVPANLLINHMTIVQELQTESVSYYHVELDRHAVILAEGLTSESYLDTGNRAYFQNAGLAMIAHPEFHVNAGLKTWEEDACAPLAIDAETVAPIWHDLAARAESLGYSRPALATTAEADIHLEANGRRLRPVASADGRYSFMLPAGTRSLTLRSRATAPADLNPLSGDWRPLGVAVRGITLRAGDDHIVIPADHPGLTQGWHTVERTASDLWRWTAGAAQLPLPAVAAPMMLDIDIASTATYILTEATTNQRLAA